MERQDQMNRKPIIVSGNVSIIQRDENITWNAHFGTITFAFLSWYLSVDVSMAHLPETITIKSNITGREVVFEHHPMDFKVSEAYYSKCEEFRLLVRCTISEIESLRSAAVEAINRGVSNLYKIQ